MASPGALDDWGNILLLELKQETCMLMGDTFGVLIQLLLGVLAFLSLLYKRYREKPRRDWDVWLADTSKQAIGSLIAHAFNMVFAGILTNSIEDNPCLYYFVNFLIDSILGMILCFVCLKLLQRTHFWERCGCCLWNSDSGFYGNPPQVRIWLGQLGVWLVIVTMVKFLLLGLVVLIKHALYKFGAWVMSPINNYPRAELVVVMVVIPFLVNVVVFWISDNFLMHSNAHPHAGNGTGNGNGAPEAKRATDAATDDDTADDKNTDDDAEDTDNLESKLTEEEEDEVADDQKLLLGNAGSIAETEDEAEDAQGGRASLSAQPTDPGDDRKDGAGGKRYSKTRIMFRQPTAARKAAAKAATEEQTLTDNALPSSKGSDVLSAARSDVEAADEGGDETPPDDPRHLVAS